VLVAARRGEPLHPQHGRVTGWVREFDVGDLRVGDEALLALDCPDELAGLVIDVDLTEIPSSLTNRTWEGRAMLGLAVASEVGGQSTPASARAPNLRHRKRRG
jgi:hypothetical protein